MRLLSRTNDGLNISANITTSLPPYAILSHTWLSDNNQEVTYDDLTSENSRHRWLATRTDGFSKLEFCLDQATRDGYKYVWVDTCCIDKQNVNELDEAIANMYSYYASAAICYVLLTDVRLNTWRDDFSNSRYFTRGWTLQELIAPTTVHFYSVEGHIIGTKEELQDVLHTATGITYQHPLRVKSILADEIPTRFQWGLNRTTTKPADQWYCMLGILDVYVPYSAGKKAEEVRRELIEGIGRRYGYPTKESVLSVYHDWRRDTAATEEPIVGAQARLTIRIPPVQVTDSHDGASSPVAHQSLTLSTPVNMKRQHSHLDPYRGIRKLHSHQRSRTPSSHSSPSSGGPRHRRHSQPNSLRPPPPTFTRSVRSDTNDYSATHDMALQSAVRQNDLQQVLRLLDNGMNVDTRFRYGQTALYDAMSNTVSTNIFAELLERGAKAEVRDHKGNSPLLWVCMMQPACAHDAWYIQSLLKHGALLSANKLGERPVHIACANGRTDLMATFLEQPASEHTFSTQRDVELLRLADPNPSSADQVARMLQVLLNRGANIHHRELKTGRMPIHHACAKKNVLFLSALLDAGSDINAKDFGGYTPLHLACEAGSAQAIELLIDRGANTQERVGPRRRLPVEIAHETHARLTKLSRKRGDQSEVKEAAFALDILKRKKMQPRKVVLPMLERARTNEA